MISSAGGAAAYIGPGAGLGAVALTIGVAVAIILILFGFVWYPLKRMAKVMLGKSPTKDDKDLK